MLRETKCPCGSEFYTQKDNRCPMCGRRSSLTL